MKCKTKIPQHILCDVCECNLCSRCEKCDIRLCRNCDNSSAILNWYEKDGIESPDVYWCDKCIKKHKKTPKQKGKVEEK
jgi:hypothetical protein